jgi:hypothetical protein
MVFAEHPIYRVLRSIGSSPKGSKLNFATEPMNLRRSPETAAVLPKVMTASSVSTVVEPEAVISGRD